ncbi:chromosome segregation protein SMC [Xanthovirga aplysinae]|uniref:chromosome segregation protein SMC n=1 Tax=Xanthovirga aplysinae TaxID=2529853 RepID=UPI0012BBD4FF|nr:chromosome segregation protein SMC [Xanthovirga aplysinae]MTI33540.1 chromosome segregation protein SMC [Xanthovirga aplysinae]
MQLTKLEIKGFKSFGDKATIHFDEGITGIVGPNGCGKSNIVDAIRWVLGEQKTKALRSEKMENIIFNGTKNRKPTQLAEVSLTFKNTKNLLPTEYNEITISRRYYRSGESEYLLNGVSCRLKDINNLFMDTGINSNSYSIIELKMVDDLLTDKDNSRRSLFEEAAGVSKFKARKKETLKKLSDTDADLERVEDLLFEIEKNMKSLERQAKQAERYFKTKEEYKALSIAYAKVSIRKHTDTFLQLNEKIQKEDDRKISLKRQLTENEALLESAKTELIKLEKLLASRQQSLNKQASLIHQTESENKIREEKKKFLEEKIQGLEEQNSQDKQSLEITQNDLLSLKYQFSSAEKILQETEVRLQELKSIYESQKARTASIQEEVNSLSRKQQTKQQSVHELNKQVEIKQMQLSTLKQEYEKAINDFNSRKSQLATLELENNELLEFISMEEQQLAELEAGEEKLRLKVEAINLEVDETKEKQHQINRQLDAKKNEFSLTKSLVDNLEGFPEATKFLKKNSGWNRQATLFSDIISCPEEYRGALESYLEPFMNYFVVENENEAFTAIQLLSEAEKGKAHFFLLNKIESKPRSIQIIPNATPAIEVIELEEKYDQLIMQLLENAYFFDGDSTQMLEANDAVLISKDASIIKRKDSISGGSVGAFEGKTIGRAKNLKKLEQEISQLTSQKDEIENKLADLAQKSVELKTSTQSEKIKNTHHELNRLRQEQIGVKTKLDQFSRFQTELNEKKEEIQEKNEILTEELYDLCPQAEEEIQNLKKLEQEINHYNEELLIHNEQLSQRSATYNQENILFHQQQNHLTNLQQEIGFKESNLENIHDRQNRNQEAYQNNKNELNQLLDKASISEDDLLSMYGEKEQIEKGVNEAETDYYTARGKISEIEQTNREFQRNRENIDSLLMAYQEKVNETKLAMSSLKERLSASFNLDLDQIMEEEDDDNFDPSEGNEEELKTKVDQLKAKIEKFGPVNPMAMEAYQEVQERFQFITSQKEDLIQAKDSLLNTISEIDTVAKDTFLDAFEKIRNNFVKVFRSLFTEEDDCSLTLSDPENPLESKIDIIAKPKGKRPLTINQLSGGEKTLTATSLLFAIYLIKPAPFCIFDEVDAPLDDANIDKFNNIIRNFSKDSQFIIVTHNKRTMSTTDIIYGITMIEMGVSRVVPVDLRELAEA